MEWLLVLSLVLIIGGNVLSVVEEWSKRGLTDTSYATLLLWVVGLLGLTCWGAVAAHDPLIALTAFFPSVLFFYWIVLKLVSWVNSKFRWSQMQRMLKNQRY